MKKVLFLGGKIVDRDFSVPDVVKYLREQSQYLHSLSIEEIIDFFNALAIYWDNSELGKKYFLRNLSDFFKKDSLKNKLTVSFRGNYSVLDKVVDIGDNNLLFHAQPRGLIVHWLAGNVPILGLFSIFIALVTKNVSLVKASPKGYNDLVFLLNTLSNIKTDRVDGKIILKSIAVILVDNEDRDTHQELSLNADVRIAWGGIEAVNSIVSLRKSIFCEDVIFGPKYSYAVIDKESLEKDGEKLVQKFAIDVSVFDQYACSSPHTLFIEEKEKGNAEDFAKKLAKQLDIINSKLLPKGEIDSVKALEIVGLGAEYEFKGKVFSSSGTEWTVVYTEEKGLAKGCFSRVIFVKPVEDIRQLGNFNNRQKQTLGVALTEENREKYLDIITIKGIDRCPKFGYMTFYESPWDGLFLFDRLVRWISIHK
jgi:hypothetical protein